MNKLNKIILSAVVGAAFFVGCAVFETKTVTPATGTSPAVTNTVVNTNLIVAVESATLTTGTQLGIQQFLKSNPKDAPYVALISQALNGAIASGNFNETTFKSAVTNAIGVSAPSEVVALVNSLITLYDASEQVIIANKLNSNVFVSAGLQAVANGLIAAQ